MYLLYTMFSDISKWSNTNDYLPILNGCILTDMIVIILLIIGVIDSQVLKEWYRVYNISAVISDVLIIFIGIIIARFLYPLVFNTFSIWKFTTLAVIIQIIHDLLFYQLFSNIPYGKNRMMDTFKKYAKEVSYKAILSDSAMMVSSILLSSFFASAKIGLNMNIIILILLVYILPYLIYTF